MSFEEAATAVGVLPSKIVFWMERGVPSQQGFGNTDFNGPIAFMESLRRRRAAGEPIAHVCLSNESPDCVGALGVSDKLPVGYDWSKQDRAGQPRRQ